MLTNEDRKESLRIFADLYSASDLNTMVHFMPEDVNDPDGERFDAYFDFLQSLYALRSDIKTMESEAELDDRLHELLSLAESFNYPTDIIEGFYA